MVINGAKDDGLPSSNTDSVKSPTKLSWLAGALFLSLSTMLKLLLSIFLSFLLSDAE